MLELGLVGDCEGDFFIDAVGDFLCTQAITTKEYNSSSESYQQTQTTARAP